MGDEAKTLVDYSSGILFSLLNFFISLNVCFKKKIEDTTIKNTIRTRTEARL